MTINRLADYLDHMRQAIADAQSFTEGLTQADFLQDKRTQQAVALFSQPGMEGTLRFELRPPRGR